VKVSIENTAVFPAEVGFFTLLTVIETAAFVLPASPPVRVSVSSLVFATAAVKWEVVVDDPKPETAVTAGAVTVRSKPVGKITLIFPSAGSAVGAVNVIVASPLTPGWRLAGTTVLVPVNAAV